MNPEFDPSNNPQTPVFFTDGQSSAPLPASSKKRPLIFAIAIVLVAALAATTFVLLHKSSPSKVSGTPVAISSTVADVAITASGYTPQNITVKQGQQVTFTNNDTTSRQLSADQTMLPGFSTVEPLDQGDTYTYIFENKGTFRYYDATDPTKLVGIVTVQ